jgi:hypothetical protein
MQLAALLLGSTLLVGLLAEYQPAAAASTDVVLDGQLLVISSSVALSADGQRRGPELSLLLDVAGELVAVVVDDSTAIEDADGQPLAAETLRAGDQLRVDATQAAPDRWWATRVVQVVGGA